MRVLVPLALLSVLTTAPPARADLITPVSQGREVTASAWSETYDEFGEPLEQDSQDDYDAPPGFASFVSGIGASANTSEGGAGVGAQQTSSIEADRLVANGGMGGYAESYGESSNSSDAASSFSVTFDLNEATTWDLSGTLEAFDDGGTYLYLDGPAGNVTSWSAYGEIVNVTDGGSLPAGQYTFVVESTGGSYGDFWGFGYASGSYDVQLIFGGQTGAPPTAAASAPVVVSPNPFRGSTRLAWGAPAPFATRADVYDVSGRLVRTLIAEPGADGLSWDGRDTADLRVPTGAYFVRLATERGISTVKVTALR